MDVAPYDQWPRCTELFHFNCTEDVPSGSTALSHVSHALLRGTLQDGGTHSGHPLRAWSHDELVSVLLAYMTLCPNSADRPVLMMSLTRSSQVGSVTVVLRTMSCHLMPRIQRWHCMWNACSRFVSIDSRVHVSDPYRERWVGCMSGTYVAWCLVITSFNPHTEKCAHGWGGDAYSAQDVWSTSSIEVLHTAQVAESINRLNILTLHANIWQRTRSSSVPQPWTFKFKAAEHGQAALCHRRSPNQSIGPSWLWHWCDTVCKLC